MFKVYIQSFDVLGGGFDEDASSSDVKEFASKFYQKNFIYFNNLFNLIFNYVKKLCTNLEDYGVKVVFDFLLIREFYYSKKVYDRYIIIIYI